ncbi:hypothetical protein IIA79_00170 [bacterium]|nr:hypothetical protein [bacterium]
MSRKQHLAQEKLAAEVEWLRSGITRIRAERLVYSPPPLPPLQAWPVLEPPWVPFWRNCQIFVTGTWVLTTLLVKCTP